MQSVALGLGAVVGVIVVGAVVLVLFEECCVKVHDLYYYKTLAKWREEREKQISDNKANIGPQYASPIKNDQGQVLQYPSLVTSQFVTVVSQ